MLPVLLRELPFVLVVTALMVVTACVLWVRFDTFAPDSADIGGLPLGAVAGGAVGAVLALVDVARRGPSTALPRWGLVAACTFVVLLVGFGAQGGLDPFWPVATLAVTLLVLVPVAAAIGVGWIVHDVRRHRRG